MRQQGAHRPGRAWARGLLATVALVAALVVVPVGSAPAATGPGGGGEFTAITPTRVLDTRSGIGFKGAVQHGLNYAARVTAPTHVPDANILAVAMNVTVIQPTAPGWLAVWPWGVPRPLASNLNFSTGQTVANLVVSGVNATGAIGIFLSAGATHVVIDIVGYYGSDGVAKRGARLIPITPNRLLDTRSGAPIASGQTRTLAIRGRSAPTSAIGVVVNVTVISPGAPGYLAVFPGPGKPNTSNVNYVRGVTRANLVMTGLGTDGAIRIYASATTHVAVDLVGYFRTGDGASTYVGRVVPLSAPFRAFDTREYGTRLGPLQREAWNFQPFVSSLTDGGAPVGPITGLVMNVTTTAATAPSYLTLFPNDKSLPRTSNINIVAGQTIPNLVVVPLSTASPPHELAAYNFGGFVHYLSDVTAVILAD